MAGSSTPASSDRSWVHALVVTGSIAAGATVLPFLVRRYSNDSDPVVFGSWWFWGPLVAGAVLATIVFGRSRLRTRLACWAGAFLGGTLAGWYVAVRSDNDVTTGILYAVFAAGLLTLPFLAWMVVVGAVMRGVAPGSAFAGQVLAVVLPFVVVASGAVIVVMGERGTFVCPPWPLSDRDMPSGACSDLVGRGDPFVVRCWIVDPDRIGRSLGTRTTDRGAVVESARRIVGVPPWRAIAIHQELVHHSATQSQRDQECGRWQFAPSSLLTEQRALELARRVASPGRFATSER
jgi:hypothetical protein